MLFLENVRYFENAPTGSTAKKLFDRKIVNPPREIKTDVETIKEIINGKQVHLYPCTS
jgi:hypothetical protein